MTQTPYTAGMISADLELLRHMLKEIAEIEEQTRAAIQNCSVAGMNIIPVETLGQRLATVLFQKDRIEHLVQIGAGLLAFAQDSAVLQQRILGFETRTSEVAGRLARMTNTLVIQERAP